MTKRACFLTIVLILLCFYYFRKHINWIALAAIGTTLAVIWAIFAQVIMAWIDRPILEIHPFKSEPPHLRRVPIRDPKTKKRLNTIYPISLKLINTGKTPAKNALPLLSGMGRLVKGKWEVPDDWIPISLIWVLDESVKRATGKPTEERALVPHRPYGFNLGFLSTNLPDSFHLGEVLIPVNQSNEYAPGEFCFEITAFADGADQARKYYRIQWDGRCTEDFEDVKKKIRVFVSDHPPWQ